MIYSCCDDRRLAVLEQQAVYNGIRFLDVVDGPSQAFPDRQRTLRVHFVNPLLPGQLGPTNVKITGGERITNIQVLQAYDETLLSPSGDPNVLVVVVNAAGDFSTYTLTLIDPNNPTQPPTPFDLILSSIDFSFKAACPSNFDCDTPVVCAPLAPEKVDISYLAKDYVSFRALMLDRMAKIIPQWQERNPADLGIVLLELLAFVGDYLSYLQDGVATEAYLGTARRRTSVRRHARLVDYPMHDGRNARTWMHLDVRADIHGLRVKPGSLQFFSKVSNPTVLFAESSNAYQQALAESPRVFELVEAVTVYAEHNAIPFYAWGDRGCCLPSGATQAWLRGSFPNLTVGSVLIFAEMKGPQTGAPEDANPTHRVAVRLTTVDATYMDPVGGQFEDPPVNSPIRVTRIEWAAEDALPFPICISNTTPTAFYDDVSIALGNNALADEGRTIANELLAVVPAPNPALSIARSTGSDRCNPSPAPLKPARYRPYLAQRPLTFADRGAYDPTASAQKAMTGRVFDSLLPEITLQTQPQTETWKPQRDLLRSHADATEFVAEVENDGTPFLRFGDETFGMRPEAGTQFVASYRIGLGLAGNVGFDSLTHVASSDPAIISDLLNPVIVSVRNPLAATGGLDPETIEAVRQAAPSAFRIQDRAVTPDDYGQMALRCDSSIQRALGTFRWTGSWQTVFITVDPQGTDVIKDTVRNNVKRGMEYFRMAGHDVDVDTPSYVSLEIDLQVCTKPGYLTSDVEQALLATLSNRILPDGTRGVFDPDNFTFGQTVYLSPVYAAAQATAGVNSVLITKFQRQGQDSDQGTTDGKLDLDRLEIARLDNDPNFPEHGKLTITFIGGQ